MELVLSLSAQALSYLPWLHQLSQPNETTTASAEATNTITQPLTDTADIAGKNESDFSSPNSANASLEKKEEKPATEATTPAATPSDSAPQTRQDRSSESTTSTSPATTETKAEEPIEDNYFRIHVKNFLKKTRMLKDSGLGTMLKNLLKTGLTEPCPSRMPKR